MMSPWLLLVLFLIHDGEEVLYLPNWVKKNAPTLDALEKRYPVMQKLLPLLRQNNQIQFSLSVLSIGGILGLICAAASLYPSFGWIQFLFLGNVVIFTVHLIVHVFQSIMLKQVGPGTITSILVFIPSLLLWQQQLDIVNVTLVYSLLISLIGAVILSPMFPLILKFGHWAGQTHTKVN
jgi:hypothetical protein